MKKVLLIILAITLLFTACNADATSGLFRTISEAREAISIKYEQILGTNTAGNTLYFRTQEGIFEATSASSKTLIIGSKADNLIQSAALVGDKILYTTNKGGSTFFVFDTTAPSAPASEGTIETDYSLIRLIQNGQALLVKDGTSYNYYVGKYNSTTKTITPESTNFASVPTGFGLDGIFVPSDFKDSSTNTKFVVSFVKADSTYKNYLYNGTSFIEISDNLKGIANIAFYPVDNLFVLTTEGKLFYVEKDGATYKDPVELASLSSATPSYERHDFFYPITNDSTLHFITNPSNTDSMTVFSVNKTTPAKATTTQTSIKAGYAATLKDTKIVSSLQLDTLEEFLVATEKHGMYSVKVKPENVNKNDSSNVDPISSAEGYTF